MVYAVSFIHRSMQHEEWMCLHFNEKLLSLQMGKPGTIQVSNQASGVLKTHYA